MDDPSPFENGKGEGEEPVVDSPSSRQTGPPPTPPNTAGASPAGPLRTKRSPSPEPHTPNTMRKIATESVQEASLAQASSLEVLGYAASLKVPLPATVPSRDKVSKKKRSSSPEPHVPNKNRKLENESPVSLGEHPPLCQVFAAPESENFEDKSEPSELSVNSYHCGHSKHHANYVRWPAEFFLHGECLIESFKNSKFRYRGTEYRMQHIRDEPLSFVSRSNVIGTELRKRLKKNSSYEGVAEVLVDNLRGIGSDIDVFVGIFTANEPNGRGIEDELHTLVLLIRVETKAFRDVQKLKWPLHHCVNELLKYFYYCTRCVVELCDEWRTDWPEGDYERYTVYRERFLKNFEKFRESETGKKVSLEEPQVESMITSETEYSSSEEAEDEEAEDQEVEAGDAEDQDFEAEDQDVEADDVEIE